MNQCLNQLLTVGVLDSKSVRGVLEEHAPLVVTKWLTLGVLPKGAKPRDEREVMALRKEVEECEDPTILSFVKPKGIGHRLLFKTTRLALEYLMDLPPHARTYYMTLPVNKPVAFYMDVDKKVGGEWEGHPDYNWADTLEALKFYVNKTWRKCDVDGKGPPDWSQVLHVFHCSSQGKVLSKHLHTTTEKKECALVFRTRGACESSLRRCNGSSLLTTGTRRVTTGARRGSLPIPPARSNFMRRKRWTRMAMCGRGRGRRLLRMCLMCKGPEISGACRFAASLRSSRCCPSI